MPNSLCQTVVGFETPGMLPMAKKSFKMACPSCEADITVTTAMIGSKTDCPKCKYRFTIPDPDAAEDDDSANEVDETPKKKKKKSNSMMLIGVGLGVAAVAILGIGGFMLFGGDSPSGGGTAAVTPRPQIANPNPVVTPIGENPGTDTPNPMGNGDTDPANPMNPMGAAAAPAKPEAPKPDAPKAVPADQLKDVTNLLPGATSALVRINVERVVQTPFYNAFLDRPTLDFFRSAMTFEATDIQTAIVCLVDPDREPFAVIRTKVPVNEKLMYERLDLSLDGEPIQGRNAFLIKSNAFVQAISRALSTESLLGEAGLPITEEDKKRWKERPMGMTIYDSQTIIIAEMDILKRWLIDLNPKTGYPP
ncbi:MAG: hypothetical protein ACRCZF_11910, partial [Gemmataceae bacterium]